MKKIFAIASLTLAAITGLYAVAGAQTLTLHNASCLDVTVAVRIRTSVLLGNQIGTCRVFVAKGASVAVSATSPFEWTGTTPTPNQYAFESAKVTEACQAVPTASFNVFPAPATPDLRPPVAVGSPVACPGGTCSYFSGVWDWAPSPTMPGSCTVQIR